MPAKFLFVSFIERVPRLAFDYSDVYLSRDFCASVRAHDQLPMIFVFFCIIY